MAGNRNNTVAAPGGPKTSAGKKSARRNALKHGLTSKMLLPQVLRKEQVNEHRVDLERQFQPANPTEPILVAEMARHAMMMELGEQAEGAVLRHGARELSKVILGWAGETSDDGANEKMPSCRRRFRQTRSTNSTAIAVVTRKRFSPRSTNFVRSSLNEENARRQTLLK